MVDVVWIVIEHNNRFLLVQRAISDIAGGTWVFPGGKVDADDPTDIFAAHRELEEEVGLSGNKFRKLCILLLDNYRIHVFLCKEWEGSPKPGCSEIIGVGWFTVAEMHTIHQSLSPFMNNSLLYLTYLIQHYEHHPNEWHNQWRTSCDDNV